jgi:hypothetical protein
VVPDLELQRKAEEERSEDPEKISIVDRGGSRRTVDLVEEAKVPKREQSHSIRRTRGREIEPFQKKSLSEERKV